MEVIGRIRVNKTTEQKVVTIPKQKETEDWKKGEIVEIRRVKINVK